ncbi:MAG: endopeptidase La [Chloroflexi bacterium]|nr:endopeptidase La [Chloroflexota bacterium]
MGHRAVCRRPRGRRARGESVRCCRSAISRPEHSFRHGTLSGSLAPGPDPPDRGGGRLPRRKRAAPAQPPVTLLPVLPIRDTVLFPHVVSPLFVDRDRSLKAIDAAMAGDRSIIVVSQRSSETQRPGEDDLFTIGTEAIVGRVLKMPDGTTSILVQGQRRVRIEGIAQEEPFIQALAVPLEEPPAAGEDLEALSRAVLSMYEKITKLSRTIPEDHYVAAMNIDEPGWLADFVVSDLEISVFQRQDVLETLDPIERLHKSSVFLAKELDVLELQSKIHSQVQQEVDKNQREYFLREQLKAIQKELGESDVMTRDIARLREKIEESGMPADVRTRAGEELDRLAAMPTMSPEVGMVRSYLDWLASLPWSQQTEDQLDLDHASQVLDANHYGLPKVKERILEFLAVRKLAVEGQRSPVLCFVGPPGVGKTSLGRSIAQAMGRKFVRISLGGIRDEAEIRGHRRTYIGALPGRILQTMKTAGTVNPVFVLDEIDKIGADFRGDPSAALLEVLDPEQNSAFSDHYLDVPYDLSKVMFITTANYLDPVPPALRDRTEVIELPGYIEEEKVQIARRFLVPKQIAENGLKDHAPHFSDAALRRLIRQYTREAGVRNLEREIGAICRKIARRVASGQKGPSAVAPSALESYLGPIRFHHTLAEERDEIGVATGVAWTPVGGDVMTVEVSLVEGKGNLSTTGQLGDVMKESAQAAWSYARSRARDLGLAEGFYEKLDVHIHVPAGAIPKDGPSAGITMATALISALTRVTACREVAMTGEITLRGRVLPVGGIREKVLAAHRAGIKTFILPEDNMKDLAEVPTDVKRQLNFVPVKTMDAVLPIALNEMSPALRAVEPRAATS